MDALAAFDANAATWEAYTHTPLGQLREALTQHYLARHLGALASPLDVLDVGGGTGGYALPLAGQGHRVCLLDVSAQMLAVARHKAEQLDPAMLDRLELVQAAVDDIPGRFGPNCFDLVLCHALLEYVLEPWAVLRTLAGVLKPGGLLSLLIVNPCADVLRWAIARGDPVRARRALYEDVSSADLFGLPRLTLRPDAVHEVLARLGVERVGEYGVRVVADHVPVDRLADPGFREQLFELEVAAGALDPYRQIARYKLIVGSKAGG